MRLYRILPLLLAAWLYMPAVRLPLFWDDVIHFRYVNNVSTEHLLTKTELVSYYRPLVNLILQIPFLLDEHPTAPLWHLVLVLNHVLNVALVGSLARQLRLGSVGQFWAMTVFAAYPFSFQAVVWVLAWFHPLVVTLILLACIFGLRAMRHLNATWLAWTFGIIAPFVHENGILTAPLLALLIALTFPKTEWKRGLLLLLPIALGTAAYGLIALRLGVGGGEGATLADVRFNAAYLMQGFTFPVQWVVGNVWLGGAIFLAIAALILRRDAIRWRIALMGAGWFVVAGLPVMLLLQESYVTSAPRLLYLGSVGVALMLGVICERLLSVDERRDGLQTLPYEPMRWSNLMRRRSPSPRWRGGRGVRSILMLALIILSADYARGRLELHNDLGAGYHQLNNLLAAQDATAPTLVINAPMWLDTEESAFPLGKHGAIFLPDYYGLNDFVWANTGIEFSKLDTIFYYPALDVWPGRVSGLEGVQAVDAGTTHGYISSHDVIYAFYVRDDDHFSARKIGQRAVVAESYVAEFAPGILLFDLTSHRRDDGLIEVAMTWERTTESPVLERPFLHLICGDAIVDQVDAHPIGNLYHFNVWMVGEVWTEFRYLDPGDTPRECLRLRLGLYDEQTGVRAAVTGPDGQPLDQDFVVLPLE